MAYIRPLGGIMERCTLLSKDNNRALSVSKKHPRELIISGLLRGRGWPLHRGRRWCAPHDSCHLTLTAALGEV